VVGVALVAVACSGTSSSDDVASDEPSGGAADDQPEADATDSIVPDAPFEGDDFYAVPDPLPEGEPGTLLRFEPIESTEVTGADLWRIMYLSESIQGEPIAVTGTALVPSTPPPDDGRPIVSGAPGTRGVADECAASRDPDQGVSSLMQPFVDEGYLVVLTDYEGLGTPGRHPYLVGESEGRSVLDAAKAARDLPDAAAGDELAILGYSQGGHAALWAGQLAADWAPEFELVGVVAGAPASELPTIFGAAGAVPQLAGFLYLAFAGYNAAYPEADLSLVLTPEGEEQVGVVDQGCVRGVLEHFASVDAGELLQPDLGSVEPWASLAAENDPGQVRTDAPILILHSAADNVVPIGFSEQLQERMCGLGQQVERRVYEEGQDHIEAAPDAIADGFEWIQQQRAGEQPVSTCPTP
jgi:acetyl esterase/lipase